MNFGASAPCGAIKSLGMVSVDSCDYADAHCREGFGQGWTTAADVSVEALDRRRKGWESAIVQDIDEPLAERRGPPSPTASSCCEAELEEVTPSPQRRRLQRPASGPAGSAPQPFEPEEDSPRGAGEAAGRLASPQQSSPQRLRSPLPAARPRLMDEPLPGLEVVADAVPETPNSVEEMVLTSPTWAAKVPSAPTADEVELKGGVLRSGRPAAKELPQAPGEESRADDAAVASPPRPRHGSGDAPAVVRIQAAWRGWRGRAEVARRRAEVVRVILDHISRGDRAQATASARRCCRSRAALSAWAHDFQRASGGGVSGVPPATRRKHAEGEVLELAAASGARSAALQRQLRRQAEHFALGAAVDRCEAASGRASGLGRLRLRLLLAAAAWVGGEEGSGGGGRQRGDSDSSKEAGGKLLTLISALCESDALERSLHVDDSLLSRLSIEGALSEAASLTSAAWGLAVLLGPRGNARLGAAPSEVVVRCLAAVARRLRADHLFGVSSLQTAARCREKVVVDIFLNEEASAVQDASRDARRVSELHAALLRKDWDAAVASAQSLLRESFKAVDEFPKRLRELHDAGKTRVLEVEVSLRREREEAHQQTTCLFGLSLTGQVEKERLDYALSSKWPRMAVVEKAAANIKRLQRELASIEVTGQANTKNRHTLRSSLRALEAKCARVDREFRDSLHGELGSMGLDDGFHGGGFQPSIDILRKQEELVEQNERFRKALDLELDNLRRSSEASVAEEAEQQGEALKADVERGAAAVDGMIAKLDTWQSKAVSAREWLVNLPLLARARSSTAAAAAHAAAAREGEEFPRFCVAVLKCLEALRSQHGSPVKAASLDLPDAGKVAALISKLRAAQGTAARLTAEYDDSQAARRAAKLAAAQAAAAAAAASEAQRPRTGSRHGGAPVPGAGAEAPSGPLWAELSPQRRCSLEADAGHPHRPRTGDVTGPKRPSLGATVGAEIVAPSLGNVFSNASAGLTDLGSTLSDLCQALAGGETLPPSRQRPSRRPGVELGGALPDDLGSPLRFVGQQHQESRRHRPQTSVLGRRVAVPAMPATGPSQLRVPSPPMVGGQLPGHRVASPLPGGLSPGGPSRGPSWCPSQEPSPSDSRPRPVQSLSPPASSHGGRPPPSLPSRSGSVSSLSFADQRPPTAGDRRSSLASSAARALRQQ